MTLTPPPLVAIALADGTTIPIDDYVRATAQPDPETGEPFPQAIKNGLEYFDVVSDRINRINDANLSHKFVAYAESPLSGKSIAFSPNFMIRLVHDPANFGSPQLISWGGCLSGSLTQEQRRAMRIDDEATAELRFTKPIRAAGILSLLLNLSVREFPAYLAGPSELTVRYSDADEVEYAMRQFLDEDYRLPNPPEVARVF